MRFAPSVSMLLLTGCCNWNTLEERIKNTNTEPQNAHASKDALEIVRDNPPIDLHADSLLWNRNLLEESSRGHADLPRWQSGNFGTQVFSTVSEAPLGNPERVYLGGIDIFGIHCLWNCWPARTLTSRLQRIMFQIDKFHSLVGNSQGQLVQITNQDEFKKHSAARAFNKSLGGILSVEGAQALDGDVANLKILAQKGVRILGLVHLTNNAFGASSSLGNTDTGLTPLGEKLVHAAEDEGILIDLSHASERTIDNVLAIAKKPTLVTHTGIKGACPHARNLSDAQAKAIAQRGGIIGIAFFEYAVCGTTVQHIAKSVVYAVKLVGARSVALGSDFDGSVSVAVRAPQISLLADSLLREGLSKNEIGMILSNNASHFFQTNLPR